MQLQAALTNRLNYLTQRQNIVAGNIANASTPNYGARDLTFQAHLAGAGSGQMVATHRQHFGIGAGRPGAGTISRQNHPLRLDGNAVRVEEETLKMGSIRGEFGLMTTTYSKMAQLYRSALGVGGQQ